MSDLFDAVTVLERIAAALESLAEGTFDHREFLLAGDALDKMHRYEEAVSIYRRYRKVQPNLGAVYNNLGKALNAAGDYAAGESVLLRGHDILPNDRWILNNLAEAYRRQGMYGKALSLYERLSSLTADEHHNLGLLAAEADLFEKARAHYIEALRLDPRLHEIRYSLAGLMLLSGDFDGAIESYETYLRSPEPNTTLARRAKSRLREAYSASGLAKLREGDVKAARRLLEYRRGLGELSAGDEQALAMVYGKLYLFGEAAVAARRAIERDPDLLPAYLALANALFELRDPGAAGYYEVFLKRWRGDPKLAGQARSQLKRLRN